MTEPDDLARQQPQVLCASTINQIPSQHLNDSVKGIRSEFRKCVTLQCQLWDEIHDMVVQLEQHSGCEEIDGLDSMISSFGSCCEIPETDFEDATIDEAIEELVKENKWRSN